LKEIVGPDKAVVVQAQHLAPVIHSAFTKIFDN